MDARTARGDLVIEMPAGKWMVFDQSGTGWAKIGGQANEHQVFVRISHAAAASSGRHPRLVVAELRVLLAGRNSASREIRDLSPYRISATVNQPSNVERVERYIATVFTTSMVPIPTRSDWAAEPPTAMPSLDLRIREISNKRPKPDSFYAEFAEVFGAQSAISTRPARDLAKANDVPVTTIHGWAKEARRRGLLTTYGDRGRRD